METELRKLPLWKDTLERMEPLEFGKTFEVKWLEEALSETAGTVQFNIAIDHMNNAIRYRGFKLSCRGMRGGGYYIKTATEIEDEVRNEQRAAARCYQRAVELGAGVLANSTANLTEAQVKALDHQTRNAAARLALIARRNPQTIADGITPKSKTIPEKT